MARTLLAQSDSDGAEPSQASNQICWRRALFLTTLFSVLCAAAFVLRLHSASAVTPTPLRRGHTGMGDETGVSFVDTSNCPAAGLNCAAQRCCSNPGFQCFQKNQDWAECKGTCPAGWACTPLGARTPLSADGKCSAMGDNCKTTQCCVTPGYQCYNKDDFWADCFENCTYSLVNNDPFDPGSRECKPLGKRTPGHAPKRIDNDDFWKPTGPLVPAGAAADCSWPGTDCRDSRCCKLNGMSCYAQNEYWASCMKKCDGENWTCDVLGGSKSNQQPLAAAKPGAALGVSLYCYSVVNPGSYEEKLLGNQKFKGAGIYACDAAKTFPGRALKVAAWGSVANVDLFVDTWRQIQAEGVYNQHDWIVKVDADAVFFPEILKKHLQSLSAPADYERGLYIKNCDYQFGFMGSLEVISKAAVTTFLSHVDNCLKSMGHDGGEDYWISTCMDALGIGHMADTTLLKDNYALPNHQKFNITSVAHCYDGWAVAFHPHKTPERWNACHDRAEQARADYVAKKEAKKDFVEKHPKAVSGNGCGKAFVQCGGKTWDGPTCCQDGCTCKGKDAYFSQCIPPKGLYTCGPLPTSV